MSNTINKKVGILGGGQLAQMLVEAANRWHLPTAVLDANPQCSARRFCGQFMQGDFKDFDAVYSFGKSMDIVTIEIENVNARALERLRAEGKSVCPSPEIISTVQDKGLQKKFYSAKNLPTAEFRLFDSKNDLRKGLMNGEIVLPLVHKIRQGGYDGRGVFKIRSEADLESVPDGACIAEKMVEIDKEISIIVARNNLGEIKCYPPAEMFFYKDRNVLDYLISPAELSPEIGDAALQITAQTAGALALVGVLAVELFLDRQGKLLINEIAPRPHNSGHQTIEANYTSQYEQHLRAILNLPLGSTLPKRRSAMVNLLGEPGYEGKPEYQGVEKVLSMDGASLTLYGKKETRPFRKMGHVTVLGNNTSELNEKIFYIRETMRIVS